MTIELPGGMRHLLDAGFRLMTLPDNGGDDPQAATHNEDLLKMHV